jgi:hypothetical protein
VFRSIRVYKLNNARWPQQVAAGAASMAKLAVKLLLASSSLRRMHRRTDWNLATFSTLVTIGLIALCLWWHSNID